jgi:hypothetical protein
MNCNPMEAHFVPGWKALVPEPGLAIKCQILFSSAFYEPDLCYAVMRADGLG